MNMLILFIVVYVWQMLENIIEGTGKPVSPACEKNAQGHASVARKVPRQNLQKVKHDHCH